MDNVPEKITVTPALLEWILTKTQTIEGITTELRKLELIRLKKEGLVHRLAQVQYKYQLDITGISNEIEMVHEQCGHPDTTLHNDSAGTTECNICGARW